MSTRPRRPTSPPPGPSTAFQDWFNLNWLPITKIVMFLLALSLVINESFFDAPPRDPVIFAAAGGLFGLPLTFGKNGNGNGK